MNIMNSRYRAAQPIPSDHTSVFSAELHSPFFLVPTESPASPQSIIDLGPHDLNQIRDALTFNVLKTTRCCFKDVLRLPGCERIHSAADTYLGAKPPIFRALEDPRKPQGDRPTNPAHQEIYDEINASLARPNAIAQMGQRETSEIHYGMASILERFRRPSRGSMEHIHQGHIEPFVRDSEFSESALRKMTIDVKPHSPLKIFLNGPPANVHYEPRCDFGVTLDGTDILILHGEVDSNRSKDDMYSPILSCVAIMRASWVLAQEGAQDLELLAIWISNQIATVSALRFLPPLSSSPANEMPTVCSRQIS